uniref:Uncharacterized protein n=1 Tax=Rhizophora mucronata TaxID=61149 RepID=A0A2P2QFI8_RHIMU
MLFNRMKDLVKHKLKLN